MLVTKTDIVSVGNAALAMRFLNQVGDDVTDDTEFDLVDMVGDALSYSDILSIIEQKVSRERVVRFACDCGLLAVPLLEDYTEYYSPIYDFLCGPVEDLVDGIKFAALLIGKSISTPLAGSITYAALTVDPKSGYIADAANAAKYTAELHTECDDGTSVTLAEQVNELLIELINEIGDDADE